MHTRKTVKLRAGFHSQYKEISVREKGHTILVIVIYKNHMPPHSFAFSFAFFYKKKKTVV